MPNIPGTKGYVHPHVWVVNQTYTPVQMLYLYFYKWYLYHFRSAERNGNTIIVTLFDESSNAFEEVILKPKDV